MVAQEVSREEGATSNILMKPSHHIMDLEDSTSSTPGATNDTDLSIPIWTKFADKFYL